MSLLLGVFLKNWKLFAIGLAVLAVVGGAFAYVNGLKGQIRRAERQRDAARVYAIRAQVNYTLCLANRLVLQAAINDQNERIEAVSEQGRRATERAAEAVRRAQIAHARDADVIARLRRPLGPGTSCEQSDEAAARAREALG